MRVVLIALMGCASSSCSEGPPPNIVLVSIDALRADHVGAYGYPGGTTPFIDSLARGGRIFERAFVPLPATAPSHASLLTSLHPLQHGVMANAEPLPAEVETLAEALRKRGYFAMGSVAVFHMKRSFGFDQGFELYSDEWSEEDPLNGPYERGAPQVTQSARAMIDTYLRQGASTPFFLFIHYFDPHLPYVDHDQFGTGARRADRSSAGNQADIIRRYDSEIRFVDEHIKQIHDHLDEHGLMANTYFVVTADHGEQLGEHGFSQGHSDIYGETLRIPLILNGPGVDPGTSERLVSSMDVGVWLLGFAGGRYSGAVRGTGFQGLGEGGDEQRKLLVLGYPTYTRSVAVVSPDRIFIRNLDRYYKQLSYMVTDRRADDLDGGRWHQAMPLKTEDGAVHYIFPELAVGETMEPVFVTAQVSLETAECSSRLRIRIDPKIPYLEPIRFRGGLEIRFPVVTLRDRVIVTVATCADKIRYQLNPFEEGSSTGEVPEGHKAVRTQLWKNLLTHRKRVHRDELYDLDADPRMLQNLAAVRDSTTELDAFGAAIDRMWRDLSGRQLQTDASAAHTEEALDMLRSLGYVQ